MSAAVSPTLLRRLKYVGLGIVAVVALLVALLAFFPWNVLRPYIGHVVTEKTGREFAIDGNLKVHPFSLTPRVEVERVRFANASWGTDPQMLQLESADFRLRLLPLLHGHVVLPEANLVRPRVVLEKSTDGRRNWLLDREQRNGEPPTIGRLTVDEGLLVFRDPETRTDINLQVSTLQGEQPNGLRLRFQAQGRYQAQPMKAVGRGGPVLALREEDQPYPLDGDVSVGATRAHLAGTITGLATFRAVDLQMTLHGDDLADLYPLFHITLPPTPPYRIAGHLVHRGEEWVLKGFAGKVGDSDLSGDFSVDLGQKPKFVRADLTSRLLDMDDLAGFVGAPPSTGRGETASPKQKREAAQQAARPRAVPDKPFHAERLKAINADVRLRATRIKREGLPIDDLVAHLKLNDGVLHLDPLNFGVAGGNVVSDVTIDARKDPMAAKADATVKRLRLNRLFPGVKLMAEESAGVVGGHLKLAGHGNSPAQQLASADGEVGLSMAGGQISNLLLEIAGLDGGEIIKFLLGGDREVRLRCAVAKFDVNRGVMKADTVVFDTTDTKVTAEGTVSLRDETLDLMLYPLPKDMSILSLRSPLRVSGTFKKPGFAPDKGALAAKGGAAALLAALAGPVAALVPLIETGPGKDSDCGALLRSVQGGRGSEATRRR